MRTRIHHLLTEAAVARPDAPALTYRDATLTYASLHAEARRVAALLAGLGLGREQRVAVYLDKRPETVAALLGASLAGGVFVPVNPVLRPRQVAHVLGDCDVRVLVTTTDRLGVLAGELEACKELSHVVLADAPPAGPDAAPGTHATVLGWPAAVSDADADGAGAGAGAGQAVETGAGDLDGVDTDVAAILYTSGSTGRPKGVVLSHRNLVVGAESVSQYLGNTADDVILAALPLSFDAGLSQVTTALSVGAHVVLHDYLLPGDVVRLCARHRVTGLTAVPPLWIQLAAQDWPEEAARHLRYLANTGGRLPRATLDRLRRLLPAAQPFLMYGLTEAFRSTYLDPAEVDRRPDSIGKAIPNAEILVVRPDGSRCEPGEEGELVHRGPLVALGYWGDPERTAERFRPAPARASGLTLPEPAVWSGDAVVRDEDGFLYFVGRQDDMIKTSGYRVSPTEVEEVAYETGLVREAAAVGVPDERLGQRIVLVVSPVGDDVDPDALLRAMRPALPQFMLPHRVAVRPSIPRSPNGKLDRGTLRVEAAAETAAGTGTGAGR